MTVERRTGGMADGGRDFLIHAPVQAGTSFLSWRSSLGGGSVEERKA